MKAFILAAGFGKRMGHYTKKTPKPLLELAKAKLIDYTLFQLKRFGITEVIVNTHYLSEQIKRYLKTLKGFQFFFSHEEEILGTAGALKKLIGKAVTEDETILLINPDAIFISKTIEPQAIAKKSKLYLLPKQADSKEPGWTFVSANQIRMNRSTGDYYYIGFSLIRPKIVNHLEENKFYELGPIWENAAAEGQVTGEVYQDFFLSVGNINEYEWAKQNFRLEPGLEAEFNDFLVSMKSQQ